MAKIGRQEIEKKVVSMLSGYGANIATANRCKQSKNRRHLDELKDPLVSSVFLEAVPAVNRSAFGRREGNLALCLAVSAGCLVHLTRSKTSRTVGPSRPTESSTICHFLFSFFFLRYNSKKQLGCSP